MLRHENEELAAHAVLAFDQVRDLKHRLNRKASNSKRRKLNTNSRWLNSADALAQCEREEAEAEAARKQAKADEKQAQEKELQQRREQRDPNEPFVGSLNSRRKQIFKISRTLWDWRLRVGWRTSNQVSTLTLTRTKNDAPVLDILASFLNSLCRFVKQHWLCCQHMLQLPVQLLLPRRYFTISLTQCSRQTFSMAIS